MPPAPASRRQTRAQRRIGLLARAAALTITASLSGCALLARAPAPSTVAHPAAPAIDEAAALIKMVVERDKSLESMQTRAVMEYSSGDRKLKAKEEIAVRRPGNLRVDAFSPLGVGLVVAARGRDLQIFDPSENKLLRGAATAETLNRFARIPMAPHDAVRLLMGLVPDAGTLPQPAAIWHADGMTVLQFHLADLRRSNLGFRDGNLAMVNVLSGAGDRSYQVRYSDYRDIGGMMLAYQIDAEFPAERTVVKFRFERPIINGHLPESLFELTPGPGATLVNLEQTAAAAPSNL